MGKLRIKQVKSGIGRPERQKRTLSALGLNKLNRIVEIEETPQSLGMVERVKHLVTVEKA